MFPGVDENRRPIPASGLFLRVAAAPLFSMITASAHGRFPVVMAAYSDRVTPAAGEGLPYLASGGRPAPQKNTAAL